MVRNRAKSASVADTQSDIRANTSNATAGDVTIEREAWIQERQNELGKIYSKHDSLVRPRFRRPFRSFANLCFITDPRTIHA